MFKNTSYIALQILLIVSFFYLMGSSLRAELSRTNLYSELTTTPVDQDIPGSAEDQDNSSGTEDNEADDSLLIFETWSWVLLPILSEPIESQRAPLFREYHLEISSPPPRIQASFS